MNSDENIYSISLEKKEIIIKKNNKKNENFNKIDELIKNVNKLSKKYDFFNRQISMDTAIFDDKLDDLINNITNLSNIIEREIIQNGNIKLKKYNNIEYI